MLNEMKIIELTSINSDLHKLSNLLINIVQDGASIGFLPPLNREDAISYWINVLSTDVTLFIAKLDDEIAGTVQLHYCMKPNGTHRAEICKLMTNTDFRRMGIASTLMRHAEERAKKEGRSLLVLDTREGDPSNKLYLSLGYIESGRIPSYAISANGELDATVFYYKILKE